MENREGLVLLAVEPEGYTQGILGTLVSANGLQQAKSLTVTVATVGSQQFAGFIDSSSCLIGNVVEIDADITGVTQVFQDMLLDISPRATVIQLFDTTLAHCSVTLLVYNFYNFRELGMLRGHIVQLVAEL